MLDHMGQLLSFLIVAGVLAPILGVLAWLGSRVRRRGVGGDIMGPVEEIWYATARSSRLVIHEQNERMVPIPSPDDH